MPFRPEEAPGRDRTPEEGARLEERLPLVGVLDNLRSAFNVGSIFRTSEAAHLAGLRLCGITPYPPNVKLDRTSLGTTYRVPWKHHVETGEAIRELRSDGYAIWAVEVSPQAVSLRDVEVPRPLALIFGHEVAGIGAVASREAERTVRIPLYGRKNSLNVATAYGVGVFEVLRRWGH